MSRRICVPSLVVLVVAAAGVVVAGPAHAAAPTISSFSPATGSTGTKVTITGAGFASPAQVSFGGVAASATVSSSTVIVTSVPARAVSGAIRVTTAAGTVVSTTTFTVAPGMSVSPSSGPPTTTTGVTFAGFSPYEAVDLYLDTTDVALISADGNGTAATTLTVPAATTPGSHWISLVGRHSGFSAQRSFLVRTDSPMFGNTSTHRENYAHENVLGPTAVAGLALSWQSESRVGAVGTPAVVGGVVYDTFGDGAVAAFDETTGVLKWSAAYASSIDDSPAVVGGVVYYGDSRGVVYAVSAATGALLWKYSTAAWVDSSPTVAGGVVFIGSEDDNLYALNATTGALLWKYQSSGLVLSSPAVANGVVYSASYDGVVTALNATSGAKLWAYSTNVHLQASPTVVDGLVIIPAGQGDKYLFALSARTGASRWIVTAGSNNGSVAVANGYVYLGSFSGTVYAVGEASGTIAWTATLPSPLSSGTTYADGVLYVSDTYNLYALSASGGAVLMTLPTETGGFAVVVDGTVTLGETSTDSVVHYTLDAASTSVVARPAVASLHPTIRA